MLCLVLRRLAYPAKLPFKPGVLPRQRLCEIDPRQEF